MVDWLGRPIETWPDDEFGPDGRRERTGGYLIRQDDEYARRVEIEATRPDCDGISARQAQTAATPKAR